MGIPGVACTGTAVQIVPALFDSGDGPEILAWGALGTNVAGERSGVRRGVDRVVRFLRARSRVNGPLVGTSVYNESIPTKIKITIGNMNMSQLPNG